MKSHAFEEYLMTQVKNNNVVFTNNDMYQLIIYKYSYIIMYMPIVYVFIERLVRNTPKYLGYTI